MSKYYVSIDVVYSETVEAESEEEALQKVINNCDFDIDPSVEPYVEEEEHD